MSAMHDSYSLALRTSWIWTFADMPAGLSTATSQTSMPSKLESPTGVGATDWRWEPATREKLSTSPRAAPSTYRGESGPPLDDVPKTTGDASVGPSPHQPPISSPRRQSWSPFSLTTTLATPVRAVN